jgi:hypothetical protein
MTTTTAVFIAIFEPYGRVYTALLLLLPTMANENDPSKRSIYAPPDAQLDKQNKTVHHSLCTLFSFWATCEMIR